MIDPLTLLLHRDAGHHGPVMLMYHSVYPRGTESSWPWSVSLERFKAHLAFLQGHGWTTSTQQALAQQGSMAAPRTVVITFDDGYADNLLAFDLLAQQGMTATWFIVSGSIGDTPTWPDDGRPSGRLLNASELRGMQSAGMEIASHTVSHRRLTELNDEQIRDELRSSKAQLEDILGEPVTSLAYPFGAFDNRVLASVGGAGYRSACTTQTGWALRDGSPFTLRRLSIFNEDTPAVLARKLTFGTNDAPWRGAVRYAATRLSRRLRPDGVES